MNSAILSQDEAVEQLDNASDWRIDERAIYREYKLPTFRLAMQFMQDMVPEINALRHHPEWSNVYNRVAVKLTTHDVDGITALDTALANRFDAVFASLVKG